MMNSLSYKVIHARPNSSRKFKMAAITMIFTIRWFRLRRYKRTWYHSRQHDILCVFLILVVLCYVLIHISTDASTLSTTSETFQRRFATGTALSVGRGGRVGRAQVSKSRGPGFKSHRCRFESWASSFTPRCLSLNECMCV